MNNENPIISVIMNCHNGELFLKEAINSVINQTYENWEIVFYNNFSNDKSENIIKSYKDIRIKYYESNNKLHLYDARNHAIKNAIGDYYAFLDVDDMWIPEKLEMQIETFNDPKVGFSCGNFFLLNGSLKKSIVHQIIPEGFVIDKMLTRYFIHMSSLMISKTAFESLEKKFNPNYTIVGDLEMCINLNLKWKLSSIQKPISYYRYHNDNTGRKLNFLYATEIELLYLELKENNLVSLLPEFTNFKNKVYWFKVVKNLHDNEKINALTSLKNLKFKHKLKLLFSIFIPYYFLKKWINFKRFSIE